MVIKTVAIGAILILAVLAEEQPKWGGNFEPSNTDYLSLESNDPIGQGATPTNETNVNEIDKVIDTILMSGRQGRNLDGFDEVYSDPNVQEVLQKGDDRQARNVIKDKLCSLGLMDCENEQIEGKRPFLPPGELIYSQPPPGYRKPNGPPNHYGPPRPMPPPHNNNGNNFGPPRKVGYAYSPQQTFGSTQSFPGPVYHVKPPGPLYVESKPPGPFYEGPQPPGPLYQGGKPQIFEGPKPPGPIYTGPDSGSPYKFENVVENFHHSHGKYEVNGHEYEGQAKPTIVVNAQGGAATTGQSAAASSVNIHHHYHHIDEGASKTPVVVNNQIPVPVPQLVSGNSISSSEFSSNGGGFSPLSSGYEYNKIKQGSSYSGAQFNGVNSGLGPVNGLSGNGVYGGGVKPVFEQTNTIGQSGFGSFDISNSYSGSAPFGHSSGGNYNGNYNNNNGGSNTQYGQSISGTYNGNTDSFHSSNPGYYKKALNTNGGANSLSYSQSGYKQQYAGQFGSTGAGENYQGFESNRQDNFDCVCVPYDQCPSVDIIGRKDDLILPLDPRHLRTDIEAVDEETVTVTDGNGTMTVVRVPKDTVDSKNTTTETIDSNKKDEPKKISKRDVSEKQSDAQEKADGEAVSFLLRFQF